MVLGQGLVQRDQSCALQSDTLDRHDTRDLVREFAVANSALKSCSLPKL